MLQFFAGHLWVLALALLLAGGAASIIMCLRSSLMLGIWSLVLATVKSEYSMFQMWHGAFLAKKVSEIDTLSADDKAALMEVLDQRSFWVIGKSVLQGQLNAAGKLLKAEYLTFMAGVLLGGAALWSSFVSPQQTTLWLLILSTGAFVTSIGMGLLTQRKILDEKLEVAPSKLSPTEDKSAISNFKPRAPMSGKDLMESALKNISSTYKKTEALKKAEAQSSSASDQTPADPSVTSDPETPPPAAPSVDTAKPAPPQNTDGEDHQPRG